MAWWIFGKKVSANNELLQKEMSDLTSLENYTKEFKGELEKLRPFLAELKNKTSKGKSLSRGEVESLQGFDNLVVESQTKYLKFKQTIITDGRNDNLKNDSSFRQVLQYVEEITNGRNKIVSLSLISEGAVSESMSKLGTALNMVDENIKALGDLLFNLKNVESFVQGELSKHVA